MHSTASSSPPLCFFGDEELTIARFPGAAPSVGLVDLVYATPWVVGALSLGHVQHLSTVPFLVIFVASWWQDWKSARAATTFYSGELVGFDLLTAGNYVALAASLSALTQSDVWIGSRTVLHWAGIFAIYIAWNLWIIRDADGATRRIFIIFALAEIPLLGMCVTILLMREGVGQYASWLDDLLLVITAVGHAALLAAWRWMSRRAE